MDSQPTTVRLKGEGGVEFDFDLPLPEVYLDQLAKGRLRPANAASADLLAPDSEFPDDPDDPDADDPDAPPARNASRDAWAAYAASLGLEIPDDAGRDDIVALVDSQDDV